MKKPRKSIFHGKKIGTSLLAIFGVSYASFALVVLITNNHQYSVNDERMTFAEVERLYTSFLENEDEYTPQSFDVFRTALQELESEEGSVLNFDKKEGLIDVLNEAYQNLVILADTKELENAYNSLKNKDLSAYTPNSADAYTKEIESAKRLLSDKNALQKDVDNEVEVLSKITDKLVLKANKEELNRIYEEITSTFDLYTPLSVEHYTKQNGDVIRLISDENATQEDVDNAISILSESLSTLMPKPNKDSLSDYIEIFTNLDSAVYKNWKEQSKFLYAAQKVFANKNATQEAVDQALSDLKTARNNLEKYTKGVYRINMYADLIEYNSIGDDFTYERYFNGRYISNGEEVTASLDSSATVSMKITEEDSVPDVGKGSASIKLVDGYTTSFYVTVRENRGKYAGNTAKFEVKVTITLLSME